ncbi:hypothetical protein JTE90_023632 [Oedothorax gibbosus]|uniref:Ionotropic glutamate receptor L-glutamate and glycine-binding domain-containing protein n=1 Tax=Oedothorax gibbosus TaxID=931172 RepID=A0AAV6U020_9ARAC|nr:hypothetical protein JTE90_023632 [Oedothorax gibbosus]
MIFPKFLRVAVVPSAGIFQVNRTNSDKLQVVGGDESAFLELLSKALKFDYELNIPDIGAWSDMVNGTWTGVVGMVHRGYADIAIVDHFSVVKVHLISASRYCCDKSKQQYFIIHFVSARQIDSHVLFYGLLVLLDDTEHGQGIEDVTDLGKRIMLGTYKAVTFAGSSFVYTMKSSGNDYIRATGEAIVQNDWFVLPDKTSVLNVLKNYDTAMKLRQERS